MAKIFYYFMFHSHKRYIDNQHKSMAIKLVITQICQMILNLWFDFFRFWPGQYSTVQYSTVQYSTVQYSTIQYSTVQYSITLALQKTAQRSIRESCRESTGDQAGLLTESATCLTRVRPRCR
jgi:hypothetical protein